MKSLYEKIVNDVPSLKLGLVYCHTCKKKLKVDSAKCLANGWPKCCGSTMSLDKPEKVK